MFVQTEPLNITGKILYFEDGDRGLVHRVRGEKVLLPHKTSNFEAGFVQVTACYEQEKVAFIEGFNVYPEKLNLSKDILLQLTLRYPLFNWIGHVTFLDQPVYKVIQMFTEFFIVLDGKITPFDDSYVERALSFMQTKSADSILESDELRNKQHSLYGNPSSLWESRNFSSDFCNNALKSLDFASSGNIDMQLFNLLGHFNFLSYGLDRHKLKEYINTENYPEQHQILGIRTGKDCFKVLSLSDRLKLIEFVRSHNDKAVDFWKERLRNLSKLGVPVEVISQLLGEFKRTGFWK